MLAFITAHDLLDAAPVILSLIIIEGLLSVDNALAIAAMASHLPGRQKFLALRLGIIGAYLFRGLVLAFAAFIIENPWLKILGAGYLIYLMSEHFAGSGRDEDHDGKPDPMKPRSFIGTIIAIEFMDLSLSVDNVVAAVAMSPKLWVVCTGVFIGILALRFVAGWCIRLLEKYPILEHTAFLLIGYVGFILCYELLSDPHGHLQIFPGPVHISSAQKFVGITIIVGLSLAYARSDALKSAFKPAFTAAILPMRGVAMAGGLVMSVVTAPVKALIRLLCNSGTRN